MDDMINILVVDDDLGMGETIFDILSDIGYNVDVANDGYKAIDMIITNDYDMVLMDIKMPGINGVEVLKKIRGIKPSLKVFMMTAYTTDDLVEESLKIGAYGVISKPINIDRLLHFIKKIQKNVKILIVDDNPIFCETLKDNLEIMKYNIIIKNKGKQAIKYIKENDVDIVLIDIKMPVLNGLEVFLEIKKINPKITGIMITAYRNEVENLVKNALANDLYDCLYKPIESEKIITLIEQIIRKNLNLLKIQQFRLGD